MGKNRKFLGVLIGLLMLVQFPVAAGAVSNKASEKALQKQLKVRVRQEELRQEKDEEREERSEKRSVKSQAQDLKHDQVKAKVATPSGLVFGTSATESGSLNGKKEDARAHVAAVHAKNLATRFDHYYQRLSGIIEKLELRFNKMEAEGVVLTEARQKLVQAKALLLTTRHTADQSVTSYKSVDSDVLGHQKELAHTATTLAKDARGGFMEVLGLLKEAIKLANTAKASK